MSTGINHPTGAPMTQPFCLGIIASKIDVEGTPLASEGLHHGFSLLYQTPHGIMKSTSSVARNKRNPVIYIGQMMLPVMNMGTSKSVLFVVET